LRAGFVGVTLVATRFFGLKMVALSTQEEYGVNFKAIIKTL
jgi:hypothetical protein